MIFAIRQLQKKYIDQHQDLYLFIMHITKMFETVSGLVLGIKVWLSQWSSESCIHFVMALCHR